jgi:hypothetical protein
MPCVVVAHRFIVRSFGKPAFKFGRRSVVVRWLLDIRHVRVWVNHDAQTGSRFITPLCNGASKTFRQHALNTINNGRSPRYRYGSEADSFRDAAQPDALHQK